MLKLESKGWIVPVIVAMSFFLLVLDYSTPKGTAEFIFYFIPVALSVLHFKGIFPLQVALATSFLNAIGYYLSPASDVDVEIALFNRLFAIVTIWVVAWLVRTVILRRNQVDEITWLRTGSIELADSIRGELTTKQVSERVLKYLAQRIDFKVGAVFLKNENSSAFQFMHGHAYLPSKEHASISPGEGILGQTAKDKKVNLFTPLQAKHLKISSSFGDNDPVSIIIAPLVVDNDTYGLIEMAFLKNPEEKDIEFLNQISESIAIALRSAEHKVKLQDLLIQAQHLAEELQAQQEELKVSNEELEQQSKALKESHVKLENQQAEMEQTNQQLEEQTQELEHQKKLLAEKNNELETKSSEIIKSSNYKSEFLANMSHELRTPLNSSLILAKLLIENKPGTLNKEQIEFAEIIYNSGNDLLNLINDILDLSKVEAGKMIIVPGVVLVEQVVKSLEQTFRPLALQKKLEYKFTIDHNVPAEIITDRQRLEQILKNFLSNAFKFTHQGGISLQIFINHDRISFAVADTGVGMSPDEQSFIFDAFRQADGTTNRKYGGTGLGLSISKELSRVLGGEIFVESIKGHGSTFILDLPLNYKESNNTIRKVKPHFPVSKPQPKELEKPTVVFSFKDDRDTIQDFTRKMLIIEDDEPFAKILLDLAREMNFGAVVSPSGDEGLDIANTIQPNAIVLDIKLPDQSGMIVLDQLKMNARTRHIPVHIISSEDFSKSALEMGAVGYMLKPVKREQLNTAFQNISTMMEHGMKHVLIVEDDEVQRKYISQLIGDKNVEVTAVETSTEALKLLSMKTFDCMIMDLSLPDMSGYELLSKLSNESSTYSFPPVIVYTARDLTPEEENKLRLYSGSIIIKGAKSPERLLSEVTLFLHKVEAELPPERQKMLRDMRSREKILLDRTILIVDDDVRNIFALTAALETHGAKIITARNGREALDKLTPSIDLILMDIMMPEMDGYEAMRKIRENDMYKALPIIALTAKAMKDDKQKCLEAGANDYLSKPVEIEKLFSLIRVWLPQKRRFT